MALCAQQGACNAEITLQNALFLSAAWNNMIKEVQ